MLRSRDYEKADQVVLYSQDLPGSHGASESCPSSPNCASERVRTCETEAQQAEESKLDKARMPEDT
jgi:hypothetical protein